MTGKSKRGCGSMKGRFGAWQRSRGRTRFGRAPVASGAAHRGSASSLTGYSPTPFCALWSDTSRWSSARLHLMAQVGSGSLADRAA